MLGETLAAIAAPARRSRRSPASRCSTTAWSAAPGIAGWDPLRLAIDVRGTGSTGYRLANVAFYDERDRPRAHSENVVVAIFGLGEPAARPASAWSRRCARRSASSAPSRGPPQTKLAPPPPWGELVVTPREAFLGPQEVVPFEQAAGRIAAEGLAAYPPASPTSCPASGSPPRRSTTSARASPTAATCAAAATAS